MRVAKQVLCDHIFMIFSIFKGERRGSAREYRFFVLHRGSLISQSAYYKTRQREGRVIRYLDLTIQEWHSPDGLPICRVCAGPNAPHDLEPKLGNVLRDYDNIWPTLGIDRSKLCLERAS